MRTSAPWTLSCSGSLHNPHPSTQQSASRGRLEKAPTFFSLSSARIRAISLTYKYEDSFLYTSCYWIIVYWHAWTLIFSYLFVGHRIVTILDLPLSNHIFVLASLVIACTTSDLAELFSTVLLYGYMPAAVRD